MRTSHDARRRALSHDTQWRLTFGFLLAIVAAPAAMFSTYVTLWYTGFEHTFGGNGLSANPYDVAGSLTAGVAIGAIAVTALGAVPGVLWLASRGPLSFRRIVLLGAGLGFIFALPALAADNRVMFLRNALFGLWIGSIASAAFWIAAIPGTELSAGRREDSVG